MMHQTEPNFVEGSGDLDSWNHDRSPNIRDSGKIIRNGYLDYDDPPGAQCP